MALVDYDNDILSKIKESEYTIHGYEQTIKNIMEEIAASNSEDTKRSLKEKLSAAKDSLENEKKTLTEYKNAHTDVAKSIQDSVISAKKNKANIRDNIDQINADVERTKTILKNEDFTFDTFDIAAAKMNLETLQKNLLKEEVSLKYAEDRSRRMNTKYEIASNLKDGWNSFTKTGGLIWKDYTDSMKFAAYRADDSKMAYSKMIAKETFRMIGSFATTGFLTFFKTSEEYFKKTVKDWITSVRDTLASTFKPIMFVVGGLTMLFKAGKSAWDFVFTKKKPKDDISDEEKANPIMKHTKVLPDILETLDNMLFNSLESREDQRNAEINAEKRFEQQQKMDARKKPEDKKEKKDSNWLMMFFGLGAFVTSYIIGRVKALVISFKLLGAPFKLLGSVLSKISGPGGMVTKGVKVIGSIFGFIGKVFSFVGGLFRPIGAFFSKATLLARFVSPFMKFIPIVGTIVSIGMSLWDFVKGWQNTEGNIFEKFIGGIKAVIDGILEWPLSLLDKLLDYFGMKPEGGLLKMFNEAFDWIYNFGWLKDLIKCIPSWILPDKIVQWAGGEKKDAQNISDAIGEKNDAKKDAKKREESKRDAEAEALRKEVADANNNSTSSSASAVSVGGSSDGGQSSPPVNENKIKDRVSPELAWAAFAATR